jgi:hypothetical protein
MIGGKAPVAGNPQGRVVICLSKAVMSVKRGPALRQAAKSGIRIVIVVLKIIRILFTGHAILSVV